MNLDPTDFRQAERLREDAREETLKKRATFDDDLMWLMKSPHGRRLAYWLLVQSGVMRTTFVETPERAQYMALAMAHDEGRKQIGYRLMAEIGRVSPDGYAKMMKENANG